MSARRVGDGSAGHDCTDDRAIMFTTATQRVRVITPLAAAGAVVATLASAVIGVRLSPMSFVVLASLVPLAIAARVDVAERRLPDHLVLASAVPALVACGLDPFVARLSVLDAVVAGSLLLAGPLLAVHLVSPEAMGFGDVKASAALGAALGLVEPVMSLWTLCIASAIAAAWGLGRRQRFVAFGPGLVLAAVVVLFVGAWRGIEVDSWR